MSLNNLGWALPAVLCIDLKNKKGFLVKKNCIYQFQGLDQAEKCLSFSQQFYDFKKFCKIDEF